MLTDCNEIIRISSRSKVVITSGECAFDAKSMNKNKNNMQSELYRTPKKKT